MALAIAPYTADLEPAVDAFNRRLEQGGVGFKFPAHDASDYAENAPVIHRGFVAVQDGANVRGGYLVKEQDFWLNDRRARLGYLHLPLSEGLIDRRYSTLGVQLIAHALKRQPLLFGLGIGGRDEAFAKVVTALGWKLEPVPFLFKILRPFRTARGLTAIRRTRSRRAMTEVAAWTGLAAVGVKALQARPGRGRSRATLSPILVDHFDRCADDLWMRHRQSYRLVAWRDAAALRSVYSDSSRAYVRVVSRTSVGDVGWAVALDTQMSGDRYFGDLRVGTIVDCFGDPALAEAIVGDVSRVLTARGVDVIVSNQASAIWTTALRQNGFVSSRSNFLFAASPALMKELGPLAESVPTFHLTRGDGDGPINL